MCKASRITGVTQNSYSLFCCCFCFEPASTFVDLYSFSEIYVWRIVQNKSLQECNIQACELLRMKKYENLKGPVTMCSLSLLLRIIF